MKNDKTILALLAGAAIGVGLGILFAPDKGEKTREKIKGNLDDLTDDLKSKLDSAKQKAENQFADSSVNLKEKLDGVIATTSEKADDVITFLEEKLAELKKQNAKLRK